MVGVAKKTYNNYVASDKLNYLCVSMASILFFMKLLIDIDTSSKPTKYSLNTINTSHQVY